MTSIPYTNFEGLLNTGVSDFLLQNNELTACKNVWVYKIGKLEKVPGYSKADSSQVIAGQNVNYLHHYYDTTNRVDYLLATSDEGSDLTLKYRTTGAWATIGSISTSWDTYAGSQPDMENYLGKTFIVGYQSGTTFLPNATINGTTFSTADSDLTNMPQGKYIVRYRDLLYVLHAKESGTVYPSRAYYCDEPSSMAISWTVSTNFIEFGYDDGDQITGAAEALDRLIVFKHFSMWKYDESTRKKIAEIGCDSFRSIVKIDKILYWFNRNGFYRWRGASPELISAKAQEFIDAIDPSKLDNVVASKYYGFEYRAFIGNVTVQGITYNNAWFCFDTRREKCYIRCTYDDVKSVAEYVEAGKKRTYFGNDNGYVMKFAEKIDEVYDDDGNEIDSFFITKNFDHGVPESVKFTNHMTVFTKNAVGMNVVVDSDNKDEFKETNKQILNNNVDTLDFSVSGNRCRYKFYEKSSSKSWEFEGFVIETDIKEQEQ